MYYSLTGTLIYKSANTIAIQCGGVGYKCNVSLATASSLPKVGEETMVFTHLSVKEDALDLFGFSSEGELSSFKMLIGINGVGPKAALSVLSELSPENFALAVASGDFKAITKAQGVGPKLAQRIVLELKDKVTSIGSDTSEFMSVASTTELSSEAVDALTVLGYSKSEAASVISKLDPALSTEEKIKKGLMALSGMGNNR